MLTLWTVFVLLKCLFLSLRSSRSVYIAAIAAAAAVVYVFFLCSVRTDWPHLQPCLCSHRTTFRVQSPAGKKAADLLATNTKKKATHTQRIYETIEKRKLVSCYMDVICCMFARFFFLIFAAFARYWFFCPEAIRWTMQTVLWCFSCSCNILLHPMTIFNCAQCCPNLNFFFFLPYHVWGFFSWMLNKSTN